MSVIFITGASGFLGVHLTSFFKKKGATVVTQARSHFADYQLNLDSKKSVYSVLNAISPDIIVNLAALASVDLCEKNPNLAFLSNTKVVENIVDWIKQDGSRCHLIHISTDHVYSKFGESKEDSVSILNTYALSKYAGELAAQSVSATVFRTNFFGRSLNPERISFTDWLVDSFRSRKQIEAFIDCYFSPLYIETLCEFIFLACNKRISGLFNLGSRGGLSKSEFIAYFGEAYGYSLENVKNIRLSDSVVINVRRPLDMRMNSRKFEKAFSIKLPTTRDQIRLALGDYID